MIYRLDLVDLEQIRLLGRAVVEQTALGCRASSAGARQAAPS